MGVREERLSVVCLEIIGGGLFQEINYIGFLFLAGGPNGRNLWDLKNMVGRTFAWGLC